MTHDRHARYDFGLNMGLDLRHGDLGHFFSELHRSQTWGILHGLLLAVIEALGGPSIRLAVLPSLLSWIGTAQFGFLAARRLAPHSATSPGLSPLCSFWRVPLITPLPPTSCSSRSAPA